MKQLADLSIWLVVIAILFINGCQQAKPALNEKDDSCKVAYYSALLKDIKNQEFTTTITAAYSGEEFPVILEYSQLTSLLDTNKSFNGSIKVRDILTRKQPLIINNQEINSVNVVRPWNRIDLIVKNGKDSTINHFFTESWQNQYISFPEREYLISILNDWCILTYVDDESGYIRIKEVSP